MEIDPFDLALVKFVTPLKAYFRRRLPDIPTAEDLTQETLARAIQARENLHNAARLEAWLYRIAHHTLADHYRERSRLITISSELPCAATTQRSELKEVLICSARCYLETLSKAYRDPVYLAEYEGMAHRDIARSLGLSLAATKARVRRGKLMVRNLMEARCRFEYDALGNVTGYQVRAMQAQAAACK